MLHVKKTAHTTQRLFMDCLDYCSEETVMFAGISEGIAYFYFIRHSFLLLYMTCTVFQFVHKHIGVHVNQYKNVSRTARLLQKH